MKDNVRPRKLTKAEEEKARGLHAGAFFWELLAAEKRRVDPATWIANGGLDAEAALMAWDDGNRHGFFSVWEERKRTGGRGAPPPMLNEASARRQVLRLCVALKDHHGLGAHAARKLVAETLKKVPVFGYPVTDTAIKHWQEREKPLGPEDEAAITAAIASHGPHRKALIDHFIGLAFTINNPAARIVKV